MVRTAAMTEAKGGLFRLSEAVFWNGLANKQAQLYDRVVGCCLDKIFCILSK